MIYLQYLRLFHQFQVSEGGQLQCAGLESVSGLVDDQHVQHNVILININIRLSIHWVRESSQLSHLNY